MGSTSVTADGAGTLLSSLKYTAFGEIRTGNSLTDYQYTGQRNEAEIGLYYYVARFYDPALGRFISADTIVPEPGSSKAYDRFAYVNGNPINYNDPSGHKMCDDEYGCSGKPTKAKLIPLPTPSPLPAKCSFSFVACMGLPVSNGTVNTKFGHQNTMDYNWDTRINTDIPSTKFENGKSLPAGTFTKDEYIDIWGIHAAVDISTTGENTPILAVYDGTVYQVYKSNVNGGNKIIIEHQFANTTYYSLYFHLAELKVDKGQSVGRGTQIGTMGDTGSEGLTHLHFEVRTSNGINNLFAPDWWWANSPGELQSNWVDISPKFGGYDAFFPDDWR